MTIAEIETEDGKPFRMRVVQKGEAYGRGMVLVHDGDVPLVEFYDARHEYERDPKGRMLGQFISRYWLDTLLGEDGFSTGSVFASGMGLTLDGGVPDWSLDAAALAQAERALIEAGHLDAPVVGKAASADTEPGI